ncbi:hypothetical protein C5167_020546 [Papaver somniferum]|uniref:Uncharacterized protein n=1 Tax=Papaver somniferum TaxID=3469 RepID=A0A4Y7IWN7_PAPSO|nr:hypothetical protein C5167_020546 [Papaver somniferum]
MKPKSVYIAFPTGCSLNWFASNWTPTVRWMSMRRCRQDELCRSVFLLMETIRESVLLLVEIQMKKEVKDGFFFSGFWDTTGSSYFTFCSALLVYATVESGRIQRCQSSRFAHRGEIISGVLSWISSGEVNSALPSHFSIMHFHSIMN